MRTRKLYQMQMAAEGTAWRSARARLAAAARWHPDAAQEYALLRKELLVERFLVGLSYYRWLQCWTEAWADRADRVAYAVANLDAHRRGIEMRAVCRQRCFEILKAHGAEIKSWMDVIEAGQLSRREAILCILAMGEEDFR